MTIIGRLTVHRQLTEEIYGLVKVRIYFIGVHIGF